MRAAAGIVIISSVLLSVVLCEDVSQVAKHKFGDNKELHDQDHIKQHLENNIEVEKLSEEQQRERIFHYFSMHDLDKDRRIYGIEVLKAITHDHEGDTGPGQGVTDEESMIRMIDGILADMDINGDGYIDFAEYSKKQSS